MRKWSRLHSASSACETIHIAHNKLKKHMESEQNSMQTNIFCHREERLTLRGLNSKSHNTQADGHEYYEENQPKTESMNRIHDMLPEGSITM